ncbi:PTS sugar transporter subunit IIC/EAL domain-containing protein [Thiocystis violacea]|uniref:PTS sugar transporter subunit IIC/EAL domain-containing protein n=1 Tax=Thiocystis violacea TaxID=13725 RepID=UPI001907C358|nr:EAL domain-containing protein [Thiocystis violacea]MBK1718320.1 hypothetical protein [Thiocystis violacea]
MSGRPATTSATPKVEGAGPKPWGAGGALPELLIRAGDRPLFLAIQRGLALVLPLIMVGALAILVRDFPSLGAQQMLDAALGPAWRIRCGNLIDGSFGIASLALLCALSGTMATLHNQRHSGPFVSPIMAAVVVLSCFFVITAPAQAGSWSELFSLSHGLLVAMGVAALGSWIFLRLSQIQWLQLPFRTVGSDPVVRDVLTVMPAGMLTILCFGLLQWALTAVGVADLYASTRDWVGQPFTDAGSGLDTGLSYVGLSQILWFFGAHGPNLLFAVEEHVLIPAGLANAAALQAGGEPVFIITKSFVDAFARIGGSGSSLCLILAILLVSRDAGGRKLAVFALFPALFNVNEPLLFGIPLILNPSYLIPFLLTPVVQTLTAFAATALDLVPHTTTAMPWTTPVLISGFVATGSVAGLVMQLINVALGTLLYIPFARLSDRVREHRGKRVLNGLLRAAESSETGSGGRKCLDRPGEEGRLAKALADDLALALKAQDQLFLEYQPQIGAKGCCVHGVEALLRWRHPAYGRIPPPVTVAIAEDMGLIDRLGAFVLAEACARRAAWRGAVPDALILSVNVSPRQLLSPAFARTVLEVLGQTGLDPHLLELEITESTVLIPDALALDSLRRLRDTGVRIAIDDFGMGHASLRYLRELPIDTVKIDRSLTVGGPGGLNEHIVRSINELSRSLGITTIVEGVELDAQLAMFLALGCETFQGYLFSRPLGPDDCLSFIGTQRKNRRQAEYSQANDGPVMLSRENL